MAGLHKRTFGRETVAVSKAEAYIIGRIGFKLGMDFRNSETF